MTDVITNLTKLPSIQDLGLTDSNIIEISGNRNIHKTKEGEDNWSQGVINYNFSVPASQGYRWSPDTSYFRADVEVVVETAPNSGTYRQPLSSDAFALSSNFMNSLISNAYVYLGDVAISSITQFVAEASQIRMRLSMSKDWLDSIGRYVYAINSNFQERQNQIISDAAPYTSEDADVIGYVGNATNTFTVLGADVTILVAGGAALPEPVPWRAGDVISYLSGAGPRVSGTVLAASSDGAGTQTLILSSSPGDRTVVTMDTADVVRLRDNNTALTNLDGKNNLQVLFTPPLGIFNCGSVIPSANSVRISLFPTSDKSGAIQTTTNSPANYDQIKVLVKQCYFYAHMFKDEKNFASGNYFIQCEEINIQNKTLNVGPGVSETTHQFVIPSASMGVTVWISSTDVGKSSSSTPPSVFKNKDGTSQNLKSLMLTYANQQKPTQLYTTEFSDTTSQIVQRFYDTAQNAQIASIGGEDFNTWLENGNLYYTSFIRPSTDRSTALTVQVAVENIPTTTPSQLFVASFFRKLTKVTVVNGMVSDVTSLSV